MIQVELVMRGPVRGEDVEGAKIRKIWTFKDLAAPEPLSPDSGRKISERRDAEFQSAVWARIIDNMNILGIKDVYGITIASIIDMRQIYP